MTRMGVFATVLCAVGFLITLAGVVRGGSVWPSVFSGVVLALIVAFGWKGRR